MRRLRPWPSRRTPTPEPQQPRLQNWIDSFAVTNRPVMRAAESQLAILAQIVCRSMRIAPDTVPTPEQEAEIQATVAEWIKRVRQQASATAKRMQGPAVSMPDRGPLSTS